MQRGQRDLRNVPKNTAKIARFLWFSELRVRGTDPALACGMSSSTEADIANQGESIVNKQSSRLFKRTLSTVLACAALVGATALTAPAAASPTDTGWTWVLGSLTVSALIQGSDNDFYAEFRKADGTPQTKWVNSSGTDVCGNNPRLRLSRSRGNFKEMVDTLNLAGLSHRSLWVAYEPSNGVCYIKSIAVNM